MVPKESWRVHVKVILIPSPKTFLLPRFHLRRCCCSCPEWFCLCPLTFFCVQPHAHAQDFCPAVKGITSRSLFSFITFIWLSPFFRLQNQQVDKMICLALTLTADLLDFHCWSSLPVILIWRQRLWRLLRPLCVNCTAPSLWMRPLCHVTSASLCFRQIHWSCSFLNSLCQGASVLLSFSVENLNQLSVWPKCLKQ